MKLAHIFTGIAALLLAGTLFLPYQTRLTYDTDFSLFAPRSVGIPTLKYTAGLELPETLPPVIALFLVAVSLFIARNLATAIIGLVLSCLMLLYMAFLSFILTFQLFGGSKDLGIGYFAGLLIVIGFLPLMIAHLHKTVRKGNQLKVREDVLDM